MSASYRDPASQQVPESRVFIDLNLFWEIIESSLVTELPQTAKSYFGASLASYRQPVHSEEVLRTRLLPEPTRIGSDASRRIDDAGSASTSQPQTLVSDPANGAADLLPPVDGDASILAQNYFALGDDLVGNLDDWWFPRQPI